MADDPVYRRYDMEAPQYGADSDKFTVQITHNGFFCGLRGDLEYCSSTTDWFDNCSADTFSGLWIKDFLNQLGHPDNGRTSVYWMRPGTSIEDGLMCIEKDADILMMTEASKEHKTLGLIVDHTGFINVLRPDVIHTVGSELSPVGNTARASTSRESSVLVSEDVDGDGEEDTDTEFYDSDWEVEDGDDDVIFAANVDKEVNDNNEPLDLVEEEDDAGLEHEASTSQPTQPENTSARQGSSYRTTPGSAYHLLFGPDKPHQQQQQQGGDLVPDLNEAAPEEMQTTQDAPPAL